MKGGKKKPTNDENQLQQIINAKLKEIIDMSIFVKNDDIKLVANLYGVKCPNCKTENNIYAETIQTRSSDEASDRICTCLKCGYHWKIRGS